MTYKPESAVLQCPKTPDAKSPMDKVIRKNTPMRDVHGQIGTPQTDCLVVERETENPSSLCSGETGDHYTPDFSSLDDEYIFNAMERLNYLLPHVISQLSENGRLSDWMAFFE